LLRKAVLVGILTRSDEAYQINWIRIRELYGLWLQVRNSSSESAPADDQSAPADDQSAPADDQSAPADKIAAPGYGMGSTRARARCHDMTCLDDDDVRSCLAKIGHTAKMIFNTLFPDQRSPLQSEDRDFVASVAILAVMHDSPRQDWQGWLQRSLRVVARRRGGLKNVIGFFRATLSNNLAEHLAICQPEQSRYLFGQLLAESRPFSQRYFLRGGTAEDAQPQAVPRQAAHLGVDRRRTIRSEQAGAVGIES
jgi:hypothetical protein